MPLFTISQEYVNLQLPLFPIRNQAPKKKAATKTKKTTKKPAAKKTAKKPAAKKTKKATKK